MIWKFYEKAQGFSNILALFMKLAKVLVFIVELAQRFEHDLVNVSKACVCQTKIISI